MVILERNKTEFGDSHIILRPNRSLTWNEAKLVMLVMFFVVMIIAVAWTFVGAWLVLPFAGIEVGLFIFLLYRVTKATYRQEVIRINDEQISIECGNFRNYQTTILDKRNVHFVYVSSENDWTLPVMQLSDGKTSVRLGSFLNIDDATKLSKTMTELEIPIVKNRWWE